jgi:hypothetical protein
VSRPCAAIYWPQVNAPSWPHAYESLRDIVFGSERALLQDCKDAGLTVPPTTGTQAFELLSYQHAAVRQAVERTLGPLRISEGSSLAHALIRDHLARLRASHDDAAFALAEPGPFSEEAALTDPGNYTFFRAVDATKKTVERVMAYPPAVDETGKYLDEIPPLRQLLYGALEALYYRTPLDPEVTGLSFTNDGHVFINWPRLYNSSLWPVIKLSARDQLTIKRAQAKGQHVTTPFNAESDPKSQFNTANIAAALFLDAAKSPARFKSALIAPDLANAPQHMPAFMAANPHQASRYIKMCETTGCFSWSPDETDPCTLVDPLKLANTPALFDGTVYLRSHNRAKQAKDMRARAVSGAAPRKPAAKVYSFPFRPYEYLETLRKIHPEPDSLPQKFWFDSSTTEVVYAIRKKEGFFFRHPTLLTPDVIRRLDVEGEMEVWTRALDSLKILERVHESRDPLNFSEQRKGWKSRFYKGVKIDYVERVAASVIQDFVSLDKLSQKEHNLVKMRLRHQFASETGEGGSRWHYKLCADAARLVTDPHMVRRIIQVVLPNAESLDPTPQHFYTPFAMSIFERFAKLSVKLLQPEHLSQDAPMQQIYTLQRPAFYIYAWTQFCREHYMASAPSQTKAPKDSRRWTPEEDFILLQGYRRPRMRNGDWSPLLSKLYNVRARDISRNVAYARLRTCNQMLKAALHPSTYSTFSVGGCYQHPLQAKRTVLLIGYLQYYQRVFGKVYRQLPHVLGILKRADRDVAAVELPKTYSDPFFREFK